MNDESYTIQRITTIVLNGAGGKPWVHWTAVGDNTGEVLFDAPTREEVISWGKRIADEVNGTWRGMSYEHWAIHMSE